MKARCFKKRMGKKMEEEKRIKIGKQRREN